MEEVKTNKITVLRGIWVFIAICSYVSLSCAAPEQLVENSEVLRTEQRIRNELDSLTEERDLYYRVLQNFLKPIDETLKLQASVANLSSLVTNQHAIISDIKEKLNAGESNVKTSMERQYMQLAKLEPQVIDLKNMWHNQTTEMSQLNQLWNELIEKTVARAAEVQNLRLSGQELERHLEDQENKLMQQEIAASGLEIKLQDAEETMRDLQNSVEEAANRQDDLEGQLHKMKSELQDLRAKRVVDDDSRKETRVDSLCRRFGLA